MIGKIALTKDGGRNFLITSFDGHTIQGIEIGVVGDFKPVVELLTKGNTPRILCDLRDILDYSKIASQLVKLVHKESEEEESKEVPKSLAPLEEEENDIALSSNTATI